MTCVEQPSVENNPSAEISAHQIELAKLAVERQKVKWTAISVMVPLLAAIGTVAFGIWSTHEQEKFNFQLEAAKSVMQAPNLSEALGRTKLFTRLFADRLPEGFFREVDLTGIAQRGDPMLEPKAGFVNTVASKGLSPLETAQLWHAMFKEDWSNNPEVMAIIEKSSANKHFPMPPPVPRP